MNQKIIKKAAIYARYSSTNQKDISIESQIAEIDNFAIKNNYVITKIYTDRAKTGTNTNRLGFQDLLKEAQSSNNSFDYVLVYHSDRFSRDIIDALTYIKLLEDNDVKLVSIAHEFGPDDTSIFPKLLSLGLNNQYVKDLSRNVKRGKKEIAKASLYNGGGIPFGYTVNTDTKKYEINENEAIIVRKIFKLYADMKSYSYIISELTNSNMYTRAGKIFSKSTISDMLRRETYIGVYTYNQVRNWGTSRNSKLYKDKEVIRNENQVPSIVTNDLFNRVQKRIEANKHRSRLQGTKEIFLLTGLIKCGCCESNFYGNTHTSGKDKKPYVTYRCSKKRHINKCKNKEINRDYLENYILELLITILFNEKNINQLYELFISEVQKRTPDLKNKKISIQKQISDYNAKIETCLDVTEKSGYNYYLQKRIEDNEKKIHILKRELEVINASKPKEITKQQFLKEIEKAKDIIIKKQTNELRELLENYIKKITIYEEDVEISLNIYGYVKLNGGAEGKRLITTSRH